MKTDHLTAKHGEELRQICIEQGDDFWSKVAHLFNEVSKITEIDTDFLQIFHDKENDTLTVEYFEDYGQGDSVSQDLVHIQLTTDGDNT